MLSMTLSLNVHKSDCMWKDAFLKHIWFRHTNLKHLLEGRSSNMWWPVCEGSVVMFLAPENRFLREGRFLPVSFLALSHWVPSHFEQPNYSHALKIIIVIIKRHSKAFVFVNFMHVWYKCSSDLTAVVYLQFDLLLIKSFLSDYPICLSK